MRPEVGKYFVTLCVSYFQFEVSPAITFAANRKKCRVNHTAFSTDCVILQHPVIGSESSQILMINNSFSSQTWAIFVPNRNSKIKSTVWPTGPPQVRSQNKAYWPYLIKIKEKVGIFAKFGENLLNLWLKIDFIELLCFKCFQNCPICALNTFGSQKIWFERMSFGQILEYWQNPKNWLLTSGDHVGHNVD